MTSLARAAARGSSGGPCGAKARVVASRARAKPRRLPRPGGSRAGCAARSWRADSGAGDRGLVGSQKAVPIEADGIVKAVASGKVAEVHRGYPSLGDVVIIENQEKRQRAVYAGSFTPIVSAGASVNLGQPSGSTRSGTSE